MTDDKLQAFKITVRARAVVSLTVNAIDLNDACKQASDYVYGETFDLGDFDDAAVTEISLDE